MTGRLLIVDDLATNRIILKVKLNAACYETLQAASGAEALRLARAELPRLIILDMSLPDLDGIEVCRRLRADPVTAHIPVVIVTASADRASRLAALAAGADEFLSKPLNEVILLARLRALLRAREAEAELRLRSETWGALDLAEETPSFDLPGRVALVARDPAIAMAWRAALAPHLSARLTLMSPAAALSDMPDSAVPDFFLIDADLGAQGSGQRLIADLRARMPSRHAAMALVLPKADPETAAMALDVGASDLIPLPFDPQEVALRIGLHVARKHRADQLRKAVSDGLRMAITDSLTGLYNRRYALAHLDRIAERAKVTGQTFAVMLLDLDRFKAVNDTYGHASGDAVLETVAHRLRDNLRPSDLLARIGGEEFLVVLPDTNLAAARIAAERLCHVIAEAPVALPATGTAILVTTSVGLALGPDPSADAGNPARSVLARADAALLAAKSDGRNQVTIASAA